PRESALGPAGRFGTPHGELLGRLPRTSDGKPAGNAGPSERGGTRNDAGAFMPSGNPASWVSGAASTDATVTKDRTTGIVEKSWTTQNSDGTTTVRTSSHNPGNGSDTTTSTTRDGT